MYDGFIWSISYFKHSHLDRSGSGRGSGLSRLARRLSQKERRTTEERRRALRQRSVSLDWSVYLCEFDHFYIAGCDLVVDVNVDMARSGFEPRQYRYMANHGTS